MGLEWLENDEPGYRQSRLPNFWVVRRLQRIMKFTKFRKCNALLYWNSLETILHVWPSRLSTIQSCDLKTEHESWEDLRHFILLLADVYLLWCREYSRQSFCHKRQAVSLGGPNSYFELNGSLDSKGLTASLKFMTSDREGWVPRLAYSQKRWCIGVLQHSLGCTAFTHNPISKDKDGKSIK